MKEKVKTILIAIILILAVPGLFLASYLAVGAYLGNNGTEVGMEKNTNVNPADSIIINFSKPVLFPNHWGRISLSPQKNFRYHWENNNKKLIIEPETFWNPETRYVVAFTGGRNIMLSTINNAQFSFNTVAYPKIAAVYPSDGQESVVLDIEEPIVLDFDKSTKGFYVKVVLDPDPEISYVINPEKTRFKVLPNEKLQEGMTYDLKVFAKYEKETDEGYKQIWESHFTTLAPAPANWEKDFTLRLNQARIYTRAKLATGKYIDINLGQQILSTFENGKLLDSYLISSGKAAMPTPKGTFKLENKTPRAWSKEYGLYMPFWNALVPDGKFGIHELPEWPGGYKEGAAHLGTPVSHGCVRLGVGPAKIVYDWAEIGTPVIIY